MTRRAGTRVSSRGLAVLVVAVVIGVAACLARDAAVSPAASSPTAPSSSAGDTVDGLTVRTVSDVIAARDSGSLGDARVAIRGFWSVVHIAHSCFPAATRPGALELRCQDGEWGITELDEPIAFVEGRSRLIPARGPHLSPWFPDELAYQLYGIPGIPGQASARVPIVLIGHFNDPRAAECREEARQRCRDRLVIEKIVAMDLGAATETTAAPTLKVDESKPLFPAATCAGKDTAYSFVGWTSVKDLGIDIDADPRVYAVVTRDVRRLGDWVDPGGTGHPFRWWGRLACIANPSEPEIVYHKGVPGSTYKEWDDGRKEFGPSP